jgi:hypothetical protein
MNSTQLIVTIICIMCLVKGCMISVVFFIGPEMDRVSIMMGNGVTASNGRTCNYHTFV